MLSLYYSTIYRGLFTHIPSAGVFAILQGCHLASDWITYAYRSSEMYWHAYNRFREFLKSCCCGPKCARLLDVIMRPPGIDTEDAAQEDLRKYVALELGLRYAAMLYSTIGIVICISCQAYVSSVWGIPKQYAVPVKTDELVTFNIFLGIGLISETLNVFIIQYIFFQPYGISIFVRFNQLMNNRYFFAFTAGIATLFLIDQVFDSELVCQKWGVLPPDEPIQPWDGQIYAHAGEDKRWYWLGRNAGGVDARTDYNVTCQLA